MSTKKDQFNTVYHNKPPMDGYVSFAGNGGPKKLKQAISSAVPQYNGIARGSNYGGYFDNFQNIRPGISGRPGFTQYDYEYFRPNESLPRRYKEMVLTCDNMYKTNELVRNVIDLMSDFTCQGIKFVHPVKSIERFYNAWFAKINGFDRSERFLNYLYRHAMVVVEARVGTLSLDVQEEFRSLAGDIEIKNKKVKSGELPLQYTFHHPALVTNINNLNSDQVLYQVLVQKTYANNNGFADKQIVDTNMFSLTGQVRPLPADKTFVSYYKRDDWEVKPVPFLYPLIKHAIMIEKLRMADLAALDGAISAVRIFKLGDMENKLFPTAEAVARLDEILQSNVGAGAIDIIWGPDIKLEQSNTDVHNFLGESKYVPHLNAMYEGLGIPPTLSGKSGGSTGGGGTTNNYMSLKMLTKRLQYGRELLVQFWNQQIKWVQKSMKFARPAQMEFDFLDLGDENQEKALLIQLADRNLISDEKIQDVFGFSSEMEKARLNRESRERTSGRRVTKPSPFTDTLEVAVTKIALQNGYITPEQAGFEPSVPADGPKQKAPFDKTLDVQKMQKQQPIGGIPSKQPKTKPKKTTGRPSSSKDTKKRKKAAFKPKAKAAFSIWASDAQDKINEIIKPEYLKLLTKSNFRQLTQKQAEDYEKVALGVLVSIDPFSTINKKLVISLLNNPIDKEIFAEYLDYTKSVEEEIGREITLDEKRQIQLVIYSSIAAEKLGQ